MKAALFTHAIGNFAHATGNFAKPSCPAKREEIMYKTLKTAKMLNNVKSKVVIIVKSKK